MSGKVSPFPICLILFSDPVKTDDEGDDDEDEEESDGAKTKRPPREMSAAERNYSEFIRSLAAKYQRNGADHRYVDFSTIFAVIL